MVSGRAGARLTPRPAHVAEPTRRAALGCAAMALLGGAASLLTGCRGGATPRGPGLEVAALAERYTRLALQLARHQPSLVEVWLGPEAWNESTRRPAPVLRASAAALLADTAPASLAAPKDARLAYLHGQVAALDVAAGRLLGESQRFADEAKRTLGHAPPPRHATVLDARRQQLSEALPPGPGTLAERHAAFRRAHAVPADWVEAVFAAAVAWCRQAAAPHLPLPAGETLTTRAADETGWAAFSRPVAPLASELWVSHRGGADAAQVLQLAAHEGSPGHHAQHVLATAELVQGRGWLERALTPSFGPHRLLAEGAAEAGADLLLPIPTREQVCAGVLLPAAGQAPADAPRLVRVERLAAALDVEVAHIASDYLDSSATAASMIGRLRDEALVLDPEGMLSFIEKQRTKVLVYPLGRLMVQAALDGVPSRDRWRRFAAITTTLTLA